MTRPAGSASGELLVVVGGGGDATSRLLVGADSRVVGRSKDADLVVHDPNVSRRHLSVRADGRVVVVEAMPGAAPFLHGGKPTTVASVGPGDHVIVGSTILSVFLAEDGAGTSGADGSTVLGGLSADVRGLSAVVSLLEGLAHAGDRDEIVLATDAWARTHLGAASASVTAKEALGNPGRGELPVALAVEAAPGTRGQGAELVARLAGDAGCLVVSFARQPEDVEEGVRAIAAVGASIVSASLASVSAKRALLAQSADLRTLAVGSARTFLGHSKAATQVDALVRKLAASDTTVLLAGESGTGKTFAARLIHEAGARANAPLRVLNCAAVPEALLESELFGSERGAFSGAIATRIGAFESAGEGTLLLDEIGELSLTGQAKILRAVEERRFERVGSNKSLTLRARILAATNRDLREMVELGTFRRDLFFRISVVTMTLPPLRDRGDDIVLLAERMLADFGPTAARRVTGFTAEARAALCAYAWPGNARELRNAVEHALVLGEDETIGVEDLPELVRGAVASARASADPMVVNLPADLRWLEERAIEAALIHTGGNRTRAAALLGINRVTLQKKLAAK